MVIGKMWEGFDGICHITSVTNAQNEKYWNDGLLQGALKSGNDEALVIRKKELKRELFKVVANQTGKIFDENVLTIVWSRRFAGYKRANLLIQDFERFLKLIENKDHPVQVIWAGKPYPEDQVAIDIFNDIHWKTKYLPNCSILTGYELGLSALLKRGSDLWLNTPRMYREASGTSGMTAAMNGSINLSIPDGWVPEFAIDGKNSFVIPRAETEDHDVQARLENEALLTMLENDIVPLYYTKPKEWLSIMKQSMKDVVPFFDSNRMAHEYYDKMYSLAGSLSDVSNKSKVEAV